MEKVTRDQIDSVSQKLVISILDHDHSNTINCLKQVLDIKCPFALLDLLGKRIGQSGVSSPQEAFSLLDEIIAYNAMGSYVIVGQALIPFLSIDFSGVMEKSREYIVKGDRWYVCDIIAERSIGYALVNHFDQTLPWLKRFLGDENRWAQRSAGTAIHFFTKRVKNDPGKARILLRLIGPHMEVKQQEIVKGLGWGLKTIGKHYPDILVKFLSGQLKIKKTVSKLMLRKAITYLSKEQKSEIENYV